MIFDHIANISFYKNLGQRINKAFEFIQTTDFSKYQKGRYDIDGDMLFFIVNEYETKSDQNNILESHRKYIDLQYMIKGCELINFEVYVNQTVNKEYDETGDYSFFVATDSNKFCLSQGMFAMFFPDDLHMPGFAHTIPEQIKKIVVKIQID